MNENQFLKLTHSDMMTSYQESLYRLHLFDTIKKLEKLSNIEATYLVFNVLVTAEEVQ